MVRRFEVLERDEGWKLTLFEDDSEVGGGVGDADDYGFLYDQGNDFIGTDTCESFSDETKVVRITT